MRACSAVVGIFTFAWLICAVGYATGVTLATLAVISICGITHK